MKKQILTIITTIALVCAAWFITLRYVPKDRPTVIYQGQVPDIVKQYEADAYKVAEVVGEKGIKQATLERVADIVGNGDMRNVPISRAAYDSLMLANIEKDKLMQRAEVLKAELIARTLQAIEAKDSLQRTVYTYQDSFLTAKFRPDTLGGQFDFAYNIHLVQHDYKKRKNFLSGYRNYTDIYAPDARIRINGMKSVTIAPPPKQRFGLGLSAGYGYTIAGDRMPYVGIGLNYNLFEF